MRTVRAGPTLMTPRRFVMTEKDSFHEPFPLIGGTRNSPLPRPIVTSTRVEPERRPDSLTTRTRPTATWPATMRSFFMRRDTDSGDGDATEATATTASASAADPSSRAARSRRPPSHRKFSWSFIACWPLRRAAVPSCTNRRLLRGAMAFTRTDPPLSCVATAAPHAGT